jgi:hypothetical protein
MGKGILSSILFLLLLQSNKIASQNDTSFWFAAPFITPDSWWRDDIKLQISTFSAPTTTVRIRQPGALAPNKYDTTIIISANSSFNYVFWRDKLATLTNTGFDSLETRPSNTVVPYGLYISSTSKINVVYNILSRAPGYFNTETFSLKGQNALGNYFMCPFQTKQNNQTVTNLAGTPPGIVQPKQQINIVASKPNTIIWINPKCAVIGNPANVSYSVVLNNLGDAFTIENSVQTSTVAGSNLSGTEITSNKPIAITLADDAVKSVTGCTDLIGDQIVPLTAIGKDYILVKGFLNSPEPEGAFILATQNSTSLTINDGVTTTTVINKGDTYHYKTTQDVTYINSDKKIYCLQLTGNGCDYASDFVPPINCSGSNVVSFTRNTPQNFYLDVICNNAATSTFTINNSLLSVTIPVLASSFTVVPGTATLAGGPYYGARLSLNSTTLLPIGSYTIANSSNVFALGICDGGATTGNVFHYSSDFQNFFSVAVTSTINSVCVSSANTLNLTGSVLGAVNSGTWTTANGSGTFGVYTSTLNTIATTYTLSNADTLLPSLKFYFTSIGVCNSKRDSLIVQIYQRPQITTIGNFSVNNTVPSITLSGTVTNAVSGIWSGGNGGTFAGSGPITNYTMVAADFSIGSGTFALASQSVLPGCLNASKTITFTFYTPQPINAIANPPQICVGQNATISANGAVSYTWTPSIPLNGIVSPSINTSYTVVGVGANTSTNVSVVTLSVDLCTGIASSQINELDNIKIHPNPSAGIFNVNCNIDSDNLVIEVYNALGQKILDEKILSENTIIDLSKYTKGIYYLKVISFQKQEVFKLIKE